MYNLRILRENLKAMAYRRARPDYDPALNRWWLLPDRLKIGRWAMEHIGHIRFGKSDELVEITFPNGDVLYTEDPLPCYNVVHVYFDVTYMGQYFQSRVPQLGEVVFDLGANVGAFALAASRLVGPTGHVYCLEPVPGNTAALAKTIEKNGLTNVTMIPKAIGETCGELLLHLGNKSTQHSAFQDRGVGDLAVPVTTLDALSAELGLSRVDFVKIDVEGMEAAVLRGASETLRRHKPFITMAGYHRRDDYTVLPQVIKEVEPSYTITCGGQPSWSEEEITARYVQEGEAAE
jgi:FkbM family methyltransferase